jgi:hypothetical protein
MTRRKFIIFAYPFDETSGGAIALHLLCRRLNEIGETALLWDSARPSPGEGWRARAVYRRLRYALRNARRPFANAFGCPMARAADLPGAILVYPEVVEGNPLGGAHVVRWLLHRPGFHTGQAVFGPDDLFFFYQEAFNDPRYNKDRCNRLTLTSVNEVYRCRNSGERSGSAYLLRKGKGRPLVHDPADAILVDALSHAEKAEVFNQVRILYSYDLYTLYSIYAALCGCISVVVPQPGLPKEKWIPDERDRYGMAYGEEEIDWAIATRDKLVARLASVEAEQEGMLRSFVVKCVAAFG